MSPTGTWLITGSNRGIGLQLTKELLSSSANTVIATCRTPDTATELHALEENVAGTLHIVPLDVSSEASMRESVQIVSSILGDGGIDVLYNNAAINPTYDTAFNFSYPEFLEILQINVGAPALLAELYYPFLERGQHKMIVNMTTGLASFGLDCGPKCSSYSISKTALNMLTYKQAKARPDFTAVCMDPGWVKTALGGEGAVLEVEESVTGILKVLSSVNTKDSGKFLRYNGTQHPW
ncbi:C-factor [Laetiporus sulphureus 93-53]|uniref:C-factor n=1 Tax=Laetiporus sulphureus 93-53 TaxID=1314785 RepID=A0A165EFV6_9APHY|nr:C-factor [Laetiporus sulphureus 93-53]KZT06973.1 C-factor [Laetiporus sulphureus 93-53]